MNPTDTISPLGMTPVVGVPQLPPPAADDDADDFVARIELLDWITQQVGVTVDAKPGQYVLGTVGRILGFGDDLKELHRRVFTAEPGLASAMVVGYYVTDDHW